MTDNEPSSELVNRLHSLRIRRGMTIQQMAEACGLPKSSLESYMRIEGARRPGVDALIAIADGMDVSIDWLVGRAEESFSPKLTEKDYAMSCFSVVQGLLNWVRARQSESQRPIIAPDAVADVPDAEIAAKSMLIFVENMAKWRRSSAAGTPRRELYDDLSKLLEGERRHD